jgi:c-di-GMP-binding flagellar brake protein YcgR
MPSQSATKAAAEPVTESDYHQYGIGSRIEISQLLHAIMRQTTLITASVGNDDFFLTTIIAIDDEDGYLLFESGRQTEQAQRVLKKQRLLCSTSLDKVKIQFVCEDIEAVEYEGHAAFKCALPREMMRLQRREYYRMAIPMGAPVKCTLSAVDGDGTAAVQLNLLDISCGGIAMLTPPDMFSPELGTQYACTIHLPGVPALRTRVQARNGFMLKLANGKLTQRSGFAFVKLPESMLAAIQRYIMNIERERRTRAARVA